MFGIIVQFTNATRSEVARVLRKFSAPITASMVSSVMVSRLLSWPSISLPSLNSAAVVVAGSHSETISALLAKS